MRKLLAAALVGLAAFTGPSSAAPVGLPARVVPIQPEVGFASFPTFGPDGSPRGDARWRLINRTGNANENYLGVTRQGRLLDHGGTYLNFSDDGGQTWSSVRPNEILLGNEGAVTAAPGGDVVGIAWDAFFGDHIVSFKYEAASEGWFYSEVPLHTPFFDRPWIAIVPGPFTVAGQTAPYISILRGGWPSKDGWFYSLDGLNYFPGIRAIETLTGSTTSLEMRPDPETDWIQPLASTGFTPLSGGGILASEGITLTGPLSVMKPPDLRWTDFDFSGTRTPTTDDAWLSDSAGRLHHVAIAGERASFVYEISVDGGKSWRSTEAKLPQGFTAGEWDFKANAQRGFGVVAIHGLDSSSPRDQDMLYVVAVDSPMPQLREILYVGNGQGTFRGSLVTGTPRYDFANVAIFPDGRIAASFKDSDHAASTIAVLMDPVGLPRTDFDTTLPVIGSFSDRPDPFTPNGDGKKDVSYVTFELSEPATTYLDVYKGEELVKTIVDYIVPAGRQKFTWDGTNDAGEPVPRGRYEYNLWAVDAAGNESDEFTWDVRVR